MAAVYFREATHPFTRIRISRFGGFTGFPRRPGRGPSWRDAARRTIARLLAGIREFIRRQRVMAELAQLSDRELADIGLCRAEIAHIFDPDFAVRHAEESGSRL